MKARMLTGLHVMAALALAGCSSTPTAETTGAPATSSTSTQPAVAAAPAASGGSAANALTGFGANDASWNAHHTEDAMFAPHSVFNFNPSLAFGKGAGRYVAVIEDGTPITSYDMNLSSGTTVDQAKVEVFAEFPSDAEIVWFKVKSSCAQMVVHSGKLAAADGTTLPSGTAMVEFSSGKAADTYDPRSVTQVLLLGIADPGPDGAGC